MRTRGQVQGQTSVSEEVADPGWPCVGYPGRSRGDIEIKHYTGRPGTPGSANKANMPSTTQGDLGRPSGKGTNKGLPRPSGLGGKSSRRPHHRGVDLTGYAVKPHIPRSGQALATRGTPKEVDTDREEQICYQRGVDGETSWPGATVSGSRLCTQGAKPTKVGRSRP